MPRYEEVANDLCSPHPRGWSQRAERRPHRALLLPAPAGMVPRHGKSPPSRTAAPRTRGDGPSSTPKRCDDQGCSPHPRGWSRVPQVRGPAAVLLPAPAGMVPTPTSTPATSRTAPRTRGDGPPCSMRRCTSPSCSPHPRGWSHPHRQTVGRQQLLPAPAGMVPAEGRRVRAGSAAPRTRGDGPTRRVVTVSDAFCSPHPRGWSRHQAEEVAGAGLLPAPAGMVPRGRSRSATARSAPRTRGDGPSPASSFRPRLICSPHPRGWSLSGRPRPPGHLCSPHPRGWPRHAGMDRGSGRLLPARGDGLHLTADRWRHPYALLTRWWRASPPPSVSSLASARSDPSPSSSPCPRSAP